MSFRDELLACWLPSDPFRPTEEALRYYEVKHEIVKRLQPTSICEIGVRAGYSAFAFLTAAPGARYLGVDWGTNGPEDIHEASLLVTHAQKILDGPHVEFMWRNSQHMRQLPGTPYDFVHVDADHTFAGCSHDLILAEGSRWILIDDFDVGPEVRAACREFLLARPGQWTAEYVPDGFRGNLLLSRNKHQG